jgi:putative intracellular protease/amidase
VSSGDEAEYLELTRGVAAMPMKVLIVQTNTSKYPNMKRATGSWLGEAVEFAEPMEKAGYQIDYISPSGGYVPYDPESLREAPDENWPWYSDHEWLNKMGTTKKASAVNAKDYDVIYFVGGHGVIWDFPENPDLQRLSREIYEAGGVVASVCHGAGALLNIKLSDGNNLINGKELTGFSNDEEKLAGLDRHVPYSTEDELRKRGAKYKKAAKPFTSYAVADGRLITGQNPESGGAVAELVIKEFSKSPRPAT